MDIDINKYIDLAILYASEYSLKIVAAIFIFVVGKWLSKKLSNLVGRLMEKANIDPTLTQFAQSLVYFALLLMVTLASLNAVGINTTSFIAVLGAASLAVGLALQGSLANLGAAVLIILFRPFKVGDFIEAGGAAGTVEEINLFSTLIKTGDNKVIIVPNSAIVGGNIVNYSNKETRRVDLTFGIGYDDDLKLAKQTLSEIVAADERVLQDPEPFIAVSELADSSVNFVVRVWVKSEDYWGVYFDMLEKVKLTFDEKGISIPYPQMDVHLDKE